MVDSHCLTLRLKAKQIAQCGLGKTRDLEIYGTEWKVQKNFTYVITDFQKRSSKGIGKLLCAHIIYESETLDPPLTQSI